MTLKRIPIIKTNLKYFFTTINPHWLIRKPYSEFSSAWEKGNFSQFEAVISPHFRHLNPHTDGREVLRLCAINSIKKARNTYKKVTEFYGKFSSISRNSISVKYE